MNKNNKHEQENKQTWIGYDGDTTEALIFTRGRKLDRQKHQTTRRIFEGYVFGGKGVGKVSSFMFVCY